MAANLTPCHNMQADIIHSGYTGSWWWEATCPTVIAYGIVPAALAILVH